MSKFLAEEGTFRVNFTDGQWWDIKKELSQGDSDYILSRVGEGISSGLAENDRVSMNIGRLAMLEAWSVAWSFTDDSGKPLPMNRENISKIKKAYRAVVLAEIIRLDKESNDYLLKNALKASTLPSTPPSQG